MSNELNFAELCRMEPALRRVEREVIARGRLAYRKRLWCTNAAWYGYGRFGGSGSLKDRMSALVGKRRSPAPADPNDAVLRSSSAYDAAYRHLYALLPTCRTCGCV